MPPTRLPAASVLGGLLFACSASTSAEIGDEPPATGSPSLTDVAPATPSAVDGTGCTQMDIVFVIDDSGSMANQQEKLAANFSKFVRVIDDYRTKSGELLDYRIAIMTSSSEKERGAFRTAGSSCPAGPSRAWLERSDPNLGEAFAYRAKVGTKGDSNERPLHALRLGLTEQATKANQGFLRPDALLAFIVITDEDEASTIQSRPEVRRIIALHPPRKVS